MNIPLRQYWELLVTYLRPQRARVLLLGALLLGSIALQLANPQLLRSFIDAAQAAGERRVLIWAALLFIGVALITQVLSVMATYLSENVGWTATNWLRRDLALHCLKLDMAFHKARTPGELIERIDGDVTALANFFSQFVIKVFGNLLLLVGVLAMLYRESWQVGLATTLFALVVLLMLLKAQSIAVPRWKAARQASAELFGFLEERLAGTEDIRSSGAVGYTMRQLYERMRVRLRLERRAALIGALTWTTPVFLYAVGTAATFLLTKSLFDANRITLGTAYLIFFYFQMLIHPLALITRQLEDLQKASAGVARIKELYQIRSAIKDGDTPLPAGALPVAFERVSFEYTDHRPPTTDLDRDKETRRQGDKETPDERHKMRDTSQGADSQPPVSGLRSPVSSSPLLPFSRSSVVGRRSSDPVLDNISFEIKPGHVLGILGRTGSGKTTLTRLLFRLYDPGRGTIRLGGVDIRAAARADLRRRVGMVTQEVQLFHATVRDNLTFFDEAIADERILRVLDDLGLTPWLLALPNGLDSVLAPAGGGLSAGEAQILAFTRVFLTNPGLVILDEASSRLDPLTERLIERAVDRLLEGRTAIVIAHRLATVLRADDILILEEGHIREYGPREQLMHDPGSRFSQLLRAGMEEVLA